MRRINAWQLVAFATVTLFCGALSARAQAPGGDPIGDAFFPPELLMQAHALIGLTEAQKGEMMEELQNMRERMGRLQEQMKNERDLLIELVSKDQVDEKKALEQVDKVMGLENDMKRSQFSLMIFIKNKLTPEQQAKLKEIKGKMSGIQAKMRKVQQLAEQIRAQGGDMSALQAAKQQLDELMKQGKTAEAEALLDETIKTLEKDAKPGK
ncbi:MAG: periplasmic heavy metal sensor [Tepidisphaeraceae bacterium]